MIIINWFNWYKHFSDYIYIQVCTCVHSYKYVCIYICTCMCISRCISHFSIRNLALAHKIIQTVIKCLSLYIDTNIHTYTYVDNKFSEIVEKRKNVKCFIFWNAYFAEKRISLSFDQLALIKNFIHKIYIHKIFQTHFRVFQFNNYIWNCDLHTYKHTYSFGLKCVWACACNIYIRLYPLLMPQTTWSP